MRPYDDDSIPYDLCRPASGHGSDASAEHPNSTFDEVESELRKKWDSANPKSKLGWDHARRARRDGSDRIDQARAHIARR